MQLTGPIFLFLFLPLSLLVVLPLSGRRRGAALLAVSLCWYLVANRQNPWGMALTGALILACWLLALPRGARRLRLLLGVVLPLSALVFCRISAEYGLLPRLIYPAGLSFVALGLVSAALDLYQRPLPGARRFVPFVGYVLFFPVLTFGPFIRYRRFRYMLAAERPSFAAFARGARFYTLGYLKRMAGAAVLVRAVNRVLAVEGDALHLPAAGVLLLLCGAALLLLIDGVSDMARGVAAFYGLSLPANMHLITRDPALFFGSLFLSLSAFLQETIARPLARHGLPGRLIGQAATFCALVLFFRFRWEALLFSLPLFLLTVPGRTVGRRPGRALRITLYILLAPAFLLFAAGVMLPNPAVLFRLASAPAVDAYYLSQLFAALSDVRYLVLDLAPWSGKPHVLMYGALGMVACLLVAPVASLKGKRK